MLEIFRFFEFKKRVKGIDVNLKKRCFWNKKDLIQINFLFQLNICCVWNQKSTILDPIWLFLRSILSAPVLCSTQTHQIQLKNYSKPQNLSKNRSKTVKFTRKISVKLTGSPFGPMLPIPGLPGIPWSPKIWTG
jgi:hypothetical protein